MTRPTPFDYDISVTADKLRRARRRGMTGEVAARARPCDHPGCDGKGLYRAPRAPNELDRFWWFCLEHVREYNRSWNFFRELSEEEFARLVESDRLWGRPTWRLGAAQGRPGAAPGWAHAEGAAWRRLGFDDPLELLGDRATRGGDPEATRPPRRRLPPSERRALDILGANDQMTRGEIRALYKSLVKQLHPDQNGGGRGEEERLRAVLWAWEQLKASRSIRD
ncbi:MAG: molecular chaperone DnaJ [Paracoccaceae bacterium]|nr:MAG: molecular chaperone DnaJ [Alphaproteobacteria bacterium]GIX13118.1 MAG: molecular chaperone DnaJ [Paracoccaceae bacterium]